MPPTIPSRGQQKNIKVMSRATQLGLGAAVLATQDSGLEVERENPERVGIVIGTGPVLTDVADLAPLLVKACTPDGRLEAQRLGRVGAASLSPLLLLRYLPNMVAGHISLTLQIRGPNSTVATACVAGTQAVGEGFRLIAHDTADVVLAGGADSRIDPVLMLAYVALGALSQADWPPAEVSRPFDRLRDGFVLGEGAGVLVLEEVERARKRGAIIYAEVLGFGSSFDAYSVIKPDPNARGAAQAITAALREARVDPQDVGYINAHGTSTRLNDVMETTAVKRAFGDGARALPLSSIKSMIGHLIGAAGAVEAVALALSLHRGVLPPTINLTHRDPECDLDYVPNTAREVSVQIGLSTSFGFGGQNGALVMRRFS